MARSRLVALALLLVSGARCDDAPPTHLNGHPLKLTADGVIETWLPNATAHHDFITRAMGHISGLPDDPVTGKPVWLTHGQIPIYNNGASAAHALMRWLSRLT